MMTRDSRVLFIVPPYYCFRDLTLQPPMATLGVLYLAAFARERGHDVHVLIPDIDPDIEPTLYLSMSQYTSRWDDYSRCIRGEKDHPVWEKIAKALDRVSPDVVAISANTPTIDSAFRVSRLVKSLRPETPVVLGGFHGTFLPDEALHPSIDYVVRGEGELPLIELLSFLAGGETPLSAVPSVSYRDGRNDVIHNPAGPGVENLDLLPFPARECVILPEGMERKDITSQAILTSRGCPHRCAFCSDRAFWQKVRRRSIENVLDEIEEIVEEFPATKELYFHDGTLTDRRSYLMRLCDGIVDRGFKLALFGTARFDELDEQLLTCMKKAGFQSLYLGAESGDPDVLASMHKRITPEMIERGLKLVQEAGLQSMVSILVGTPHETEKSLKLTIQLMERIQPTSFDINSYLPLPGSDYYAELPDEILAKVNYLDFAYKSPAPFLFVTRGQEHLLKYVEEIYAIADARFAD